MRSSIMARGLLRAATAGSRLASAQPPRWLRAMSTTPDVGSAVPNADLSQSKSHSFQAETSKLLQIVASSLYSERKSPSPGSERAKARQF